MSTFQKKLQQDRSNEKTSNAGLKWDSEDDKYLLENAKNGTDIKEIALALKRTEGSIKTRIIINILSMIGNDRNKLSNMCSEYNVTEDDVSIYEQKKEQREQKRLGRPSYQYEKKNSFPSSETAEMLEGLSHLNQKMDSLMEKMNDVLKKMK
jgi:predicted transcriptional regulator|tara:strand:- start:2014 stop:2469 length:456 start_codon:yes stop_codon:yes gene_type:complete